MEKKTDEEYNEQRLLDLSRRNVEALEKIAAKVEYAARTVRTFTVVYVITWVVLISALGYFMLKVATKS